MNNDVMNDEVIKPISNLVLIDLGSVDREKTTAGGIVIAETIREKDDRGTVLAVGEGTRLDNGTVVPIHVSVGDRVIFNVHGGTEMVQGDRRVKLVREIDILAVCEMAAKDDSDTQDIETVEISVTVFPHYLMQFPKPQYGDRVLTDNDLLAIGKIISDTPSDLVYYKGEKVVFIVPSDQDVPKDGVGCNLIVPAKDILAKCELQRE